VSAPRSVAPYPHTYSARAEGARSGLTRLSSNGLPVLASAPAPQFGGPGDLWSPETLLVCAIADCYILTFRAVSAAALFGWIRLECRTEGTLQELERRPQFTDFRLDATLTVPQGADASKAKRLLQQTERACLLINSLKGRHVLEALVVHEGADQGLGT
jgi:organic hydroperoxide reductase OsmC/OhrA